MRNHEPPLPLRLCASLTASCFAWSLALAPSACAAATRAPRAPGSVRALSPDEMRAIVGAQSLQQQTPLTADPGSAMPWVETVNGTDTGNGNKTTALPLVGWTARGGLPVAFTLSHGSQSAHNAELGYKWSHSYDISLAVVQGGVGANATSRAAAAANTTNPMAVTWGMGSPTPSPTTAAASSPPRPASTTR